MPSLINRAQVKNYTLATLQAKRPHLAEKKTRVSAEYFERIDAKVRNLIQHEVDGMHSVGVTIK